MRVSILSTLVVAASLAIGLGGCTAPWAGGYQGVTFLPPATYVSTAFISSRGDVLLVPQKDSVIGGVTMPNGEPVPWRVDGSYVVLPAESIKAVHWVNLNIDGRMRRQWLRHNR